MNTALKMEPQTMISEEEKERRRKIVLNAIRSCEIEGTSPGDEAKDIFEDFIEGRIEGHEIIVHMKALWNKK